jgi:hypothetical protein
VAEFPDEGLFAAAVVFSGMDGSTVVGAAAELGDEEEQPAASATATASGAAPASRIRRARADGVIQGSSL